MEFLAQRNLLSLESDRLFKHTFRMGCADLYFLQNYKKMSHAISSTGITESSDNPLQFMSFTFIFPEAE